MFTFLSRLFGMSANHSGNSETTYHVDMLCNNGEWRSIFSTNDRAKAHNHMRYWIEEDNCNPDWIRVS